MVAFLSVTSKAAGLALTTRFLTLIFPYLNSEWHFFFEILACLSMGIGNLVALTQTSLKRMLGYSSVGQAGFLLIGIITGGEDGYGSMFIYLLIYLLMNLGAFAGAIIFGLRTGSDQIKDFSGLGKKRSYASYRFKCSLTFFRRNSTFSWFLRKTVSILGRLESWLFFLNYLCAYH